MKKAGLDFNMRMVQGYKEGQRMHRCGPLTFISKNPQKKFGCAEMSGHGFVHEEELGGKDLNHQPGCSSLQTSSIAIV